MHALMVYDQVSLLYNFMNNNQALHVDVCEILNQYTLYTCTLIHTLCSEFRLLSILVPILGTETFIYTQTKLLWLTFSR